MTYKKFTKRLTPEKWTDIDPFETAFDDLQVSDIELFKKFNIPAIPKKFIK